MLNKYKRKNPLLTLSNDMYWDMVLSQDRAYRRTFDDGDCGLVVDTALSGCGDTFVSRVSWSGCTCEDTTLEDIGLTGIDNGFIRYQRDRISNQEFFDIISNSRHHIDQGDCFMRFHRVTGNTGQFSYSNECTDKDGNVLPYSVLKGGFFQGFYALKGFDYFILPSVVTDSWNVMLKVRPRDYEEASNTLNSTHDDNDGFIFYIGTRAENKFAQFYNSNLDKFPQREFSRECNTVESDYFAKDEKQIYAETSCDDLWLPEFYEVICHDGGNCGCEKPEPCECRKDKNKPCQKADIDWKHFLNTYGYSEYSFCGPQCSPCTGHSTTSKCPTGKCNDGMKLELPSLNTTSCGCGQKHGNNHKCGGGGCTDGQKLEPAQDLSKRPIECGCGCKKKPVKKDPCGCGGSYFIDDYHVTSACDNGSFLATGDGYFKDVTLSGITLTTADGKPLDDQGYYEIETDNKFLTFNRTKTGFIVDNYDPEATVMLTGSTRYESQNKFLTYNRTKTGLTAYGCALKAGMKEMGDSEKEYNVITDIKDNAFGVRIRKDGSIGYRYLVTDCESEDGYSILEEYSYPDTVKKDVWSEIRIEIIALRYPSPDGFMRIDTSTYKIRIHVNGKLRFVSKEIPAFRLRALDEMPEKQEGVPYNISIGGGTQGLCDSVWLDYYKPFLWILPLERYFAGTFIGDISGFRLFIGDCNGTA